MFYRVIVHVANVEPLSVYCGGIETDENGNFDFVNPLTVVEHPPMPEDTEVGDICLAYVNLGLMNFAHRDVVFQPGKPIERLYRKDDPIPDPFV
jgi:hypothetical protein